MRAVCLEATKQHCAEVQAMLGTWLDTVADRLAQVSWHVRMAACLTLLWCTMHGSAFQPSKYGEAD